MSATRSRPVVGNIPSSVTVCSAFHQDRMSFQCLLNSPKLKSRPVLLDSTVIMLLIFFFSFSIAASCYANSLFSLELWKDSCKLRVFHYTSVLPFEEWWLLFVMRPLATVVAWGNNGLQVARSCSGWRPSDQFRRLCSVNQVCCHHPKFRMKITVQRCGGGGIVVAPVIEVRGAKCSAM